LGAVFCLGFAALSLRLADVQLASAAEWRAMGRGQRIDTRPIPASRGDLLDRYGAPLALSVPVFDVVIDQAGIAEAPRFVGSVGSNAGRLAAILERPVAEIEAAMHGTARRHVVARGIDDRVALRVRAARIPGVALEERTVRRYPAGSTARGVVGRVAPDQRGKTGLELVLDKRLLGRDGEQRIEFGRGGRSIPQGEYTIRSAEHGANIITTLDRAMQYRVEEVLTDWVTVTGAKGGTVVILDRATADVLVMATVHRRPPSATRSDASGAAPEAEVMVTNYPAAVVDTFEPGSMMKAITVAGALDERVMGMDETLVVPDRLRVADHVFSDDTPHPHMKWTLRDVLVNSSNTGTIMVARRMGKDAVDRNLVDFGFGRPAGLGFLYEAQGRWLPPRRWTGTSIGTIPIGQGVTVTALQMAAAYNAIANDGVYLAPRLQRGWTDATGKRFERRPENGRQVIGAQTAASMRSMLASVVKDGSGRNAAVLGYQVAGKTGTARKVVNGSYLKGAYVSSFAGMFPASSPKLTMVVTIDQPETDYYASTIAAPLFGEVTRIAAQRYRIAPAAGEHVALNVRAPQWSAALADAQAARREALAGPVDRAPAVGRSRGAAEPSVTSVVTARAAAEPVSAAEPVGAVEVEEGDAGEAEVEAPVVTRRRVQSWPATTAVVAGATADEANGPDTSAPRRRRAASADAATASGAEPVAAARTATAVEAGDP
jgi:cell division protein FtsI (penicillin-binding protein 3)